MLEALHYPFFVRALLAGLLASIASGVVGSYVVVKRISTISGGLSHAAFGGVGLAYLLGVPPMLGGGVFALLAGLGIGVAYQRLKTSLDTMIAAAWSVGMALGIVFVSLKEGYTPDLMRFLFGSILFVSEPWLYFTLGLDLVVLLVVGLLFVPLRASAFDSEFTEVMGVPSGKLFNLMMVLVALTVVLLIQVVGVILTIALLTLPAVIARHWTDHLGTMMALASAICAAVFASGLFLAYDLTDRFDADIPTGPVIILIAATLYAVSAAAARFRDRSRPPLPTPPGA